MAIDQTEIRKWFDVFHHEGDVTEIRLIGKYGRNFSGYFKTAEAIINALHPYSDGYGIYSPINQIAEACYSRSQSEKLIASRTTTGDNEITGRRWLLIDLDPKRPSDTNSTDAEKALAFTLMRRIAVYLQNQGFRSPVYADSANGYHIYYRIQLANTQENTDLIRDFLLAMELMFGNESVDIDTTVFNASRISKVIGTCSSKGSNTAERPQRMSCFLQIPDEIEATDISYIRKIASMLPKAEKPSRENNWSSGRFDLDGFIEQHGIRIAKRTSFKQGEKYVLESCPFDSNHKAPDAALFRLESGAIGFKCLHNSCSHYGWRDFRLHFDPNAYTRRVYDESRSRSDYYKPKDEKPVIEAESEEKGRKWQRMKDIRFKDISEIVHIPTGIAEIDRRIIGFAMGDLTVVSGLNASGKTSLLNHFILAAVQRNYKCLVWSGELQGFRFQNWLDLMAAGPSYAVKKAGYDNFYYVPRSIAEKVNEWLDDRVLLYNNDYGSKFSQLYADIQEQVETTDAKLVICDNLMAIQLDEHYRDKNEVQSGLIQKLKDLAKQKNIHIILVCHPRKEPGVTLLRKDSIAGTADLTNTADNVFIIHRVGMDFEKRGEQFFGKGRIAEYKNFGNVIEVCKHRTTGLQDYLVGLYFDIPSHRFKNTLDEHIVYGWQDDDLPSDDMPLGNDFDTKPQPQVASVSSFAPKGVDTYGGDSKLVMPVAETAKKVEETNIDDTDDLPF